MKEVAKRVANPPCKEEIKKQELKIQRIKQESDKLISDLFAELDAIEGNSVEEKRSSRR